MSDKSKAGEPQAGPASPAPKRPAEGVSPVDRTDHGHETGPGPNMDAVRAGNIVEGDALPRVQSGDRNNEGA